VQVAGQAERLGEVHNAHTPQVLAGDYRDRRSHIGETLDASRCGRDVGVCKFFDGKLFEFFELARAGCLRKCVAGERDNNGKRNQEGHSGVVELAKKGPKGAYQRSPSVYPQKGNLMI